MYVIKYIIYHLHCIFYVKSFIVDIGMCEHQNANSEDISSK